MSDSVRIKELLADSFFYGLVVICLAMLGYLLYAGWQGTHPAPKAHWSQGPQDPEPTH
ncbi:hypothetical protein [Rhizobium sp.]